MYIHLLLYSGQEKFHRSDMAFYCVEHLGIKIRLEIYKTMSYLLIGKLYETSSDTGSSIIYILCKN